MRGSGTHGRDRGQVMSMEGIGGGLLGSGGRIRGGGSVHGGVVGTWEGLLGPGGDHSICWELAGMERSFPDPLGPGAIFNCRSPRTQ